jgi:hypothetical protein
MTTRTASCRCGQLSATVVGEPVRVSACHCLACKKRTGSAFSVQARWPADQVSIAGTSRRFTRTPDTGNPLDYHFCAECGATVHYMSANLPGLVAIPLGLFDDPFFASPAFSVWEERKHDWVEIVGADVEHSD